MTDQEELKRRMSSLENYIQDHSRRLSGLETHKAADHVRNENINKRLDSIEDTLKWLVRLIISALILAAIGFALGGGFTLV